MVIRWSSVHAFKGATLSPPIAADEEPPMPGVHARLRPNVKQEFKQRLKIGRSMVIRICLAAEGPRTERELFVKIA